MDLNWVIGFIVLLIVLGMVWQLVLPHVAEPFRQVIIVVMVLFLALALLSMFGVIDFPIGRSRGVNIDSRPLRVN